MSRIFVSIGLTLWLAIGTTATAQTLPPTGGLPPWHFGMTTQEVTSKVDYGPYKLFSNGDLETYNGLFDGRKTNVQFFFNEGKVVRIGAYLYEGEDIEAATKVWADAYRALKTSYGTIETPDITLDRPTASTDPDVIANAARGNVQVSGKSQMAPFNQPADAFVFASFRRNNVTGRVIYYVTVTYEPPHR